MGHLTDENGEATYLWASDVTFDGIRLEVASEGRVLFDVSIPQDGPITVNTLSHEVDAGLIEAALVLARKRRRDEAE